MKKINIETELNFETFVEGMKKGYSGCGDGKQFKFSKFGNKEVKDFSVSQDVILAYNNYTTAKQILINSLIKEK